jgi:hypothetical protein
MKSAAPAHPCARGISVSMYVIACIRLHGCMKVRIQGYRRDRKPVMAKVDRFGNSDRERSGMPKPRATHGVAADGII